MVHTFLMRGRANNPGACPLHTFLVGRPSGAPPHGTGNPVHDCNQRVSFRCSFVSGHPCMLCSYLVWYMRLPSRGPRNFGCLHTALTVVTVVSSLTMIEVPVTGILEKYDVPDVIMKWVWRS